MTRNIVRQLSFTVPIALNLIAVSVMMIDPAVAFQPGAGYGAFDRGVERDIFLKNPNGSLSLGVVWPGGSIRHFFDFLRVTDVEVGVTVFPGISFASCSVFLTHSGRTSQIGSTRTHKSTFRYISVFTHVNVFLGSYWNNEFKLFFNPRTGIDIDGAWIDMNEPASVSLVGFVFHPDR